jgi:hypothetical protein
MESNIVETGRVAINVFDIASNVLLARKCGQVIPGGLKHYFTKLFKQAAVSIDGRKVLTDSLYSERPVEQRPRIGLDEALAALK